MSFDKKLKKYQSDISYSYLKYAKNLRKQGYYNSPFLYPCTWYENFSKSFLNSISIKKYDFRFYFSYFKEILIILHLLNYKLYMPKNTLNNKYNNFYITWFKDKDIIFGKLKRDRYINKKINYNKDLILCINLEANFTDQRLKNTLVFSKSKSFGINILLNLFYIIKFLLKSILNGKIIYSLNVYSVFADLLYENIKNLIENATIKQVYMSYEGQPFQNLLIRKFKENLKNVKIIGLVKSFQPFPLHLYKSNDSPHKIQCCHPLIKNHMINNLYWKKDDFLKYTSYKLNNLKNVILFPFSIKDYNEIYKIFISLSRYKGFKHFGNFKIKIHPNTTEVKEQNNLKEKLQKIFQPLKKNKNSKIVMAIGATSVIVENLILGNTVFQIYENEKLECLSSKFWPRIKSQKIFQNVVKYNF